MALGAPQPREAYILQKPPSKTPRFLVPENDLQRLLGSEFESFQFQPFARSQFPLHLLRCIQRSYLARPEINLSKKPSKAVAKLVLKGIS